MPIQMQMQMLSEGANAMTDIPKAPTHPFFFHSTPIWSTLAVLPQGRIVCDGVLKWTFHVLQRMTTLLFPLLVQWVSFQYPFLSMPSHSGPVLCMLFIPSRRRYTLLYSDGDLGKCDLYLVMPSPMRDDLFRFRSCRRHHIDMADTTMTAS